jgi:hypothetical protein
MARPKVKKNQPSKNSDKIPRTNSPHTGSESKDLDENKDIINSSFKFSKESKQNPEEKNLDTSVSQKRVKTIPSPNKNKSLRFSKYSIRKDEHKWNLPILSYIEPVVYNPNPHKGVDFSKMMDRNSNDIFNSNYANPGVCYYQPKYDSVFKRSPNAIFYDKNHIDMKNDKHLIINKLWRSYEVSSDYKTVKFKKSE